MPTKSNNMSPMPMQSKIGDASLKFGPDWLRALSSSETTGNNPGPSPGGDMGGPPPGSGFPIGGGGHRFGPSGWGSSEGRSGFHFNSGGGANKDHNSYASASQFSIPSALHHQQQHMGHGPPPPREGNKMSGGGAAPTPSRFKPSEHRYSREEILALFDKNLEAPTFLVNFGTLYIEKMQPPLSFSQPSEEEIRIWHSPQPESSRQGSTATVVGRGYVPRGRGIGIDRGRGRGGGRGGYYGRPHEEEERGSFSRPRTFERSQSNHERVAWGDRNGIGIGGPPNSSVPDENNRGSGSWRSRDSFGGRRYDENDDGWRRPRWRREDEEDYRSGSGARRLHRSWSEDENHDNIPEWARDNPSEESGTFDATGAFHDDRSKGRDGERRSEIGDSNCASKARAESEPSGSHSDRVQRRVSDRAESITPVIPPSAKEKIETISEEGAEFMSSSGQQRTTRERSDPFPQSVPSQQHPQSPATQNHSVNSITTQRKMDHDPSHKNDDRINLQKLQQLEIQSQQQMHVQQQMKNVQHNLNSSHEAVKQQLVHSQSVMNSATGSGQHSHQHQQPDILRASSVPDQSNRGGSRNNEEDFFSMTEEAMSLVTKLIEEDAGGRRLPPSVISSLRNAVMSPQQQVPEPVKSKNPNTTSMNVNDMSRAPAPSTHPTQPQNVTPVHAPSASTGSPDTWYYRDPQGSVQGPFSTHEMAQWCNQGYFAPSLLLRRECDKTFITLMEMSTLYGRNPFTMSDSVPPPPIQDPNTSALDFSRDGSQIQAQLHHQQRQQQLIQQNILREQYMLNMGGRGTNIRKEGSSWPQNMPENPQQNRPVSDPSLTAAQIQAQLMMSMAKSQGVDRDPNNIDQLHNLFQRQLKPSNDSMMPQSQNQKHYSDMLAPSQTTPTMDVPKSPAPLADPIQSLVQQLTSMANTHQKVPTKPDVINSWGQTPPSNAAPPVQHGHGHIVPNSQTHTQWGSSHPTATPWEYRDQMAKLQQDEELRRRKDEEEAEIKRLEDDERKRLEEQQRLVAERKRQEEQRSEEEKQRKLREEQYLLQKQQELMKKQQEEAELQRQKELQRQQLEQQRQLRDEQTRLAEQQQQQQRLEQQRLEKEQAEREQAMRQELERQEQLKQQFSWNTSAPPQQPQVGSKSLVEIQQEEAIKQEKEANIKKKQQQEQLRIQQQQQQQAQQQKSANFKWAQSAAPVAKAPIKSFTEIQAEEQAKLQKQQEAEREKRAILTHQQQQQQAWNAQLTWANRASQIGGNTSTSGSKKVNGGVWEDTSLSSKLKANNPSPTVPASSNNNRQSSGGGGGSGSTKTKEMSEDAFMKLFSVHNDAESSKGTSARPKVGGGGPPDEFTRWCSDKIQTIASGTVDIPTFVSFLKDVESPYEVGDYVRSYLGDGKEAKEFAREFLERRSRWKNSRKDGTGTSVEDNLCRPASAVNPNSNDFQEVKGKKTKKGKMQKVDSRILGFSTSAAADRLNRDRDFGDSTD